MTELTINTDNLEFDKFEGLALGQLQILVGFLIRVLVSRQVRTTLDAGTLEGYVNDYMERVNFMDLLSDMDWGNMLSEVDFSEDIDHDKLVEHVDMDELVRKVWYHYDDEVVQQVNDNLDLYEIASNVDIDYGSVVDEIDTGDLSSSLIQRIKSCSEAKEVVQTCLAAVLPDVLKGMSAGALETVGLEGRVQLALGQVNERVAQVEATLADVIPEIKDTINTIKSRLRDGLRHVVGLLD